MLNSSRDKNEGTYRSGEGEGAPPRYVTPDLSYTATGKEGESSARINGRRKKNKIETSSSHKPPGMHIANTER